MLATEKRPDNRTKETLLEPWFCGGEGDGVPLSPSILLFLYSVAYGNSNAPVQGQRPPAVPLLSHMNLGTCSTVTYTSDSKFLHIFLTHDLFYKHNT